MTIRAEDFPELSADEVAALNDPAVLALARKVLADPDLTAAIRDLLAALP